MKVYKSIEEGTWTTPSKYPITVEEVALLNAEETEENKESKAALKAIITEYLVANPSGEITEDEVAVLNKLYTDNKPQLAEDQTYKLIDTAIFKHQNQEGTDIYSGIINCRVKSSGAEFGEHLQIRF